MEREEKKDRRGWYRSLRRDARGGTKIEGKEIVIDGKIVAKEFLENKTINIRK